MYESVFRFRQRPFSWAPRTELYFPAPNTDLALQTLARCVARAEGPGLLIGAPGTGKSLLCQLLARQFSETFHVALLSSNQLCTRRALLQNILFELGQPYRGLEEGELRLSLIDFLSPARSDRAGLLLLVDEAHTLPLRLVEELRMITNLVRDGQPRVRLVLAGGSILEERFSSPKLECFNQRIAARCYLQPLNYEETAQCVCAQIAAVDGRPEELFTPDALSAVYHATDGIPRLINQVCDHALMLAAIGRRNQIDESVIQEAWADLQQLPTPWQETTRQAPAQDNVIEFGSLDEPDELPTVTPFEPVAADASDETPDDPADDSSAEPDVRRDLVAQLDELQLKVAELEADDVDQDRPEPAGVSDEPSLATWTESEEPAAASAESALFREDYEYEEVVVDRYAAIEANPLGAPPPQAAPAAEERDVQEPLAIIGAAFEADGRGAADDTPHTPPANPVRVLRNLPPDDNDLIVVIDDEPAAKRSAAQSKHSGRQEYRRLFSRLRES